MNSWLTTKRKLRENRRLPRRRATNIAIDKMITSIIRIAIENMISMISTEEATSITKEAGTIPILSRVIIGSTGPLRVETKRTASSSIQLRKQPTTRLFYKSKRHWRRRRWSEYQA